MHYRFLPEFSISTLSLRENHTCAPLTSQVQFDIAALGSQRGSFGSFANLLGQFLASNLPDPPEEIWRDFNQQACVKQRIEELKSDLGAGVFCLQEFFATEAAFLDILMLFNLLAEFQRASGMTGYRQPTTLRVQVSLCGALLGRAGHRTMLHLSAAGAGIKKRNPLFDKLLLYEIPTPRKLEIQPHATG